MHAARAPYYLFYDEKGTFLYAIANPFSAIDHGAAPRAAQLLHENHANRLVASEFGDKFASLLKRNHIDTMIGDSPVAEIIQKLST